MFEAGLASCRSADSLKALTGSTENLKINKEKVSYCKQIASRHLWLTL